VCFQSIHGFPCGSAPVTKRSVRQNLPSVNLYFFQFGSALPASSKIWRIFFDKLVGVKGLGKN